jgi:hypothetical protein
MTPQTDTQAPVSIYQSTLTAAGYANRAGLTAAANDSSDAAAQRIALKLLLAFGELQMAEERLDSRLERLASIVASEAANRASTGHVVTSWISQVAAELERAEAEVEAAEEQIRVLVWLRDGSPAS